MMSSNIVTIRNQQWIYVPNVLTIWAHELFRSCHAEVGWLPRMTSKYIVQPLNSFMSLWRATRLFNQDLKPLRVFSTPPFNFSNIIPLVSELSQLQSFKWSTFSEFLCIRQCQSSSSNTYNIRREPVHF